MDLDDKGIVFVGKKVQANDISSELSLSGIRCQIIHGNREQYDREQALELHPFLGSSQCVQVNITQY